MHSLRFRSAHKHCQVPTEEADWCTARSDRSGILGRDLLLLA